MRLKELSIKDGMVMVEEVLENVKVVRRYLSSNEFTSGITVGEWKNIVDRLVQAGMPVGTKFVAFAVSLCGLSPVGRMKWIINYLDTVLAKLTLLNLKVKEADVVYMEELLEPMRLPSPKQ